MKPRKIPDGVKTLGEAIRLLREEQSITLRALADKVGVSAPFLSDLEHGRRQTDKHEELAKALNVELDALKALDSRVTSDLKDWLGENPKLLNLLKEMKRSGRPVPVDALQTVLNKRK